MLDNQPISPGGVILLLCPDSRLIAIFYNELYNEAVASKDKAAVPTLKPGMYIQAV